MEGPVNDGDGWERWTIGPKQGRGPDECKVFFLTKPIIGDTDEAAQRRADELYANAPVEAGLASLSTMLQMDLSTYDLDKPLPAAIQTRAIQGIRSQLDRFYMSGRTPTLRDIATRKVSIDSRPYIGTAERVADELARTIDAVGGDGFAIRRAATELEIARAALGEHPPEIQAGVQGHGRPEALPSPGNPGEERAADHRRQRRRCPDGRRWVRPRRRRRHRSGGCRRNTRCGRRAYARGRGARARQARHDR